MNSFKLRPETLFVGGVLVGSLVTTGLTEASRLYYLYTAERSVNTGEFDSAGNLLVQNPKVLKLLPSFDGELYFMEIVFVPKGLSDKDSVIIQRLPIHSNASIEAIQGFINRHGGDLAEGEEPSEGLYKIATDLDDSTGLWSITGITYQDKTAISGVLQIEGESYTFDSSQPAVG